MNVNARSAQIVRYRISSGNPYYLDILISIFPFISITFISISLLYIVGHLNWLLSVTVLHTEHGSTQITDSQQLTTAYF